MTRFVRRASITAALLVAPLLTVSAPALAAGPAPATATTAATAQPNGDYPPADHPYRHRKRPTNRPTTAPTTRPTTTPTAPATTAPTTPATRPTTAPSTPAATRPTTAPTTPPVTVPSTPPVAVPSTPPVTVPSTPPVAVPSTSPAAPVDARSASEAEVVALTNAQRVANGCGALRTDDRLVAAARAHSGDMVTQKFFSHTGSDGSDFVARVVRTGYTGASAENIAWGYRTPQEVVTGWMESPGHRANILNCASVAVGVGLTLAADGTPYWTQDFGRI